MPNASLVARRILPPTTDRPRDRPIKSAAQLAPTALFLSEATMKQNPSNVNDSWESYRKAVVGSGVPTATAQRKRRESIRVQDGRMGVFRKRTDARFWTLVGTKWKSRLIGDAG